MKTVPFNHGLTDALAEDGASVVPATFVGTALCATMSS
jgi:hypothetical protein